MASVRRLLLTDGLLCKPMPHHQGLIGEHFLNPRNVGEIEDADGRGEACSFVCGALLRISLKINTASQTISDARFKAIGCRYLVAQASVLTETVKELRLSRAVRLDENAITDWFGELPPDKTHCASLCREALLAALADYHHLMREEDWTGEEALICTCFGVSEREIEHEIKARSLRTVREVTRACNAGGGCRSCHPLIEDILDDHWRTYGSPDLRNNQ